MAAWRRTGAVLICGALAGCGGGDGSHSFADVSACVRENAATAGLQVDQNGLDLLAEQAGEGAIVVRNDRQEVQIVVERSTTDADRTASGYEAFGATDDNLIVDGNVVVAFTKTPTDNERTVIEECL